MRPTARRRVDARRRVVDARIIHRVVLHPRPRARSESIRSRAVTSRARSTPSPSSDRIRAASIRPYLGSVGRPRCLNRGRPRERRARRRWTSDGREKTSRPRSGRPRPRPRPRDETRDGRRADVSIDRDRARSSHSFTPTNRTFGATVARETRLCARAGLAASGINPVFNAKATMVCACRVRATM